MSKVTFERVRADIVEWGEGYPTTGDWARCDLARPVSELRAIAALMQTLPWIGCARVHDAALHLSVDDDHSLMVQERSFHAALGLARRTLASQLALLATVEPKETAEPLLLVGHHHDWRGATASIKGGGATLAMPEGDYSTGFAIIHLEGDDGETDEIHGYFLRTRYDDGSMPLATALLDMAFPELGVVELRRRSYGEIVLTRDLDGIRDRAVALYRCATSMIRIYADAMKELQWGGAPSSFTTEDDDARDELAARAMASGRIERVRTDSEWSEWDESTTYSIDGEEVPVHLVRRLENAGIIEPEGKWSFERRPGGAPLVDLVAHDRPDKALLAPRAKAVDFQVFQEWCSSRRHPEDHDDECAHKRSSCGTCSIESCPITIQTYHEDRGITFHCGDDPAFDDQDWERSVLVRALDPRTERSKAWKGARTEPTRALVTEVMRAHADHVERFLVDDGRRGSLEPALADGRLVVVERLRIGTIVALSDDLAAQAESLRTWRKAA